MVIDNGLFSSLVGSSVEYRFKNDTEAMKIDDVLPAERTKIMRYTDMALKEGGTLCVMLLSEITKFYMSAPYYMAVRGCIRMHRFRPRVLEYMPLEPSVRADRLKKALSSGSRDVAVAAIMYFLRTYPSRAKSFVPLLTKEERLMII